MTPAEMVERDRQARNEAGKRKFRPNGGPFVTMHPHGLLGEAYEECLDALNYLELAGDAPRVGGAWYAVYCAAELLAAEIGDKV